jgi:hypothetical protein
MILSCDLHNHSCLSPCGDLSMSPSLIAKVLHAHGIKLAALTDHNSALNCPAFAATCTKYDIAVLHGIEAQTAEEVHILCLFPCLDQALELGENLYQLMPAIMNIPEKTGDQVYVDEHEDILGEVDKYLVTSADIPLDDLAKMVHEIGGLCIPAHVDRPAFSLTSQLGFIPDGPWDALEVVRMPEQNRQKAEKPVQPCQSYPDTHGYPLITSSDAHYPEHIARRPFTLDIGELPLYDQHGNVSLETIRAALQKRPCYIL